MSLQDLKNKLRMHQGQIKAWALHYDTFLTVVDGLDDSAFNLLPPCAKLFEIPVVFVTQDQPEGIVI